MSFLRYARSLSVLLVILLLAAATARAAKDPNEDGDKWDPTEVLGPLVDRGEVEPNNTPATANPFACGDVLRPATITPAGDFDFIVFSATMGDIIQFGTDADGATGQVGDTFIDLISSDGTTVLLSDDDGGPGLYSLLTYTATYTGNYYGKIRAFSSTATGGYKAFVTCLTPLPATCDLREYKGDLQTFPTPVAIPDNLLAGVTVGPIATANDATRFLDVVLSVRIAHTFVGDLVATLMYDQDCDGTPETSARVICRPGRALCDGTLGSPFGCSSNLACNNLYYVSDAGAAELGLPPLGCGATGAVLGGACYKPNATGEALSVFDNLTKGGCFWLNVADHGIGDTGTICEWGVYTLNEVVVPVEGTTWGKLKTRYGASR